MKAISLVILTALCIALLSAASCKSQPAIVYLGQEFELKTGEIVNIDGENVELEFVRVTQDSRCPIGAVCIQAGQAVCAIQLTRSGTIYEAILTELGGSEANEQNILGYRFTFNVLPYPEAGKEIQLENYRLVLKLTKLV
jgi:hypothetical protein